MSFQKLCTTLGSQVFSGGVQLTPQKLVFITSLPISKNLMADCCHGLILLRLKIDCAFLRAKQHSELLYKASNGQFKSKMDLSLEKVGKMTSASLTNNQDLWNIVWASRSMNCYYHQDYVQQCQGGHG